MKNSDAIYYTLVKQFGLKFKAQYNNSYIVFERYLHVKDVVTDQSHYALVLDQGKVIKFIDKDGFIVNFILYLEKELEGLDRQFKDLQRIEREERWHDENALFFEHEEIGHKMQKFSALLKKIESFKK